MNKELSTTDLRAYLDHAAATPVRPAVAASYADLCLRFPANPHGTTRFSEAARLAVESAGRRLLTLLGGTPDRDKLVWTSGGTESVNLACLGVLRRHQGGTCLVDATAHAALLASCRQWACENGGNCVEIPVLADGCLDLTAPQLDLPPAQVHAVAICHVNNETGSMQDLAAIRGFMRRRAPRAALVVDATQSLGKVPIPWREAEIDLLAVSGRKIGGPASTGAVMCRDTMTLRPLLFGGGQQDDIRPGTIDVIGVLGFVHAAEQTMRTQSREFERMRSLNEMLRHQLRQRWASAVEILSPATASPYILAVSFPGYEGAVLMRALAQRGVLVGAGSACSAESATPSHVIAAMGRDHRVARGMLRISFGYSTRQNEVDTLLDALTAVLADY